MPPFNGQILGQLEKKEIKNKIRLRNRIIKTKKMDVLSLETVKNNMIHKIS